MHRRLSLLVAWAALAAPCAGGEIPESLVVEGVPAVPPALRAKADRYLEFRAAAFADWHPVRREMLIATRFAEANQLHLVRQPGGARRQLTFRTEPVTSGRFQPTRGDFLVFSQDSGGGEFYQLYRYDLEDGEVTLLTDGKSRNTGPLWSNGGQWLAYSSTRRNGADTDVYLIDPLDPATDRLILKVGGGSWSVTDWSTDDRRLLLLQYVSINETYLHLYDLEAGEIHNLTPRDGAPAAYGRAEFTRDGRAVLTTTDRGGEFHRLVRIDLDTGEHQALGAAPKWDVEDFELSPDGRTVAQVTNEDGASVLRFLDADTGKERSRARLPLGLITGLTWHRKGREVGFAFSSARSPNDVYSVEAKSGKIERWTESETGGLDPQRFPEPDIIRVASFDGRAISAFVYRPDPERFPGPRPVLVNLHGGPESQARPVFQARNNYYLEELGVALVYPNVRGSAGYGKSFLTLDNGLQREDAVRDVGAILDWVGRDRGLDADRVAVMGGSYGGYMALASLVHYSPRLRAGVDIVGISNFVTFLNNTQDYRRDLRRVEYGDERDPAVREFLERISPLRQVGKITRPLLVVQGLNDPRVPATESEQMVKALRERGGVAWYVLGRDEGHGFARKRNQDYQFLATILFLEEHLLKP